MKIATKHYQLEFPKYAKKVKTKIIPETLDDEKEIYQVLDHAHINYRLIGENIIGLYGKPVDLAQKLKEILIGSTSATQSYYNIALCLQNDLKFRAILA